MKKVVLDKKIIEEAVKSAIGDAFAGFSERPDAPCECSIGVFEILDDTGWRGLWTECIKKIVREKTPTAECVCVKPLSAGDVAWYSIIVA